MFKNYILVEGKDVESFIDEPWFNNEAIEAFLLQLEPSYFIPEHRVINNEYITQKVEELSLLYESSKEENDSVANSYPELNTKESIINLKLTLE